MHICLPGEVPSNHDINTAAYESKVKEIFKLIDKKAW